MPSLKLVLPFLAGAVFIACLSAFLLTWTQPRAVPLSAASLKVWHVTLNGENFIAVAGPRFNALGAHQYLAYCVEQDKIEIRYFVTRVTLSNGRAYQSDWPLLIPQDKFLSQRTVLTCRSRSNDEAVATILQNGGGLEIQSNNR